MPAEVNFAQAGAANQPSPSIWSDCPKTLLNDLGLGVYRHVDFLGASTGTLAAALDVAQTSFGDALAIDADTDTVLSLKASERGGYLDIETDGDDNDAAALISEPFARVTKNSGEKVWLEARLEIGAVADQGVALVVAEEAALSRDVIADDAGALIDESYVGFRLLADDTDAFDAVYKKDDGTEVEVLEDVTNATAIPSDDRASVAANTEVKLGLRFDGRDHLRFYVNGVKVATQTVDSTIDQSKRLGVALAIKTGTGAANSIAVDWVRYAYQERS